MLHLPLSVVQVRVPPRALLLLLLVVLQPVEQWKAARLKPRCPFPTACRPRRWPC
jgi:hypothetical protein